MCEILLIHEQLSTTFANNLDHLHMYLTYSIHSPCILLTSLPFITGWGWISVDLCSTVPASAKFAAVQCPVGVGSGTDNRNS